MNIQKNIKNIQKNIKNIQKTIKTKIIILFGVVILLIFLFFYFKYKREDFALPTGHERPFVNVFGVKNDQRDQLSIILLSHPFTKIHPINSMKIIKRINF